MARAENRKYHYIYKITCNVTNRFYIGMHSTDNLNDGYLGSGKRLWFSINYHGKENHTKEILEFLETRELLKEREKFLVNKELISEDLCMNLVIGGEGGGFRDEEHFKKFQLAGSKAGNDAKTLRLQTDSEYRENYSKIVSLASKTRMGNGNWTNPNKGHWKNRKHSEETKALMSEKAKERVGEKNSQYGTCWVTKDGVNKKVKKENLESFLDEGWVKGRK